ncbi:MAG: LysR family transcriptional regulator [Leptolyngbyaceae cyanobacterium SM2_5_2]|nr:LysR family transcriptional regulator [Leptolyngbyaceae cyanobacterium SM2_5_2]
MDKFESIRAFTQVVEAGGFAAAARRMGLSRSAVNKLVMNLEEHLQTQLLHRTTRRVAPTDAGRAFYERCLTILTDLEEAELALSRLQEEPRGNLRINAPMSFGTLHLAPLLVDFMAQYPDLHVELSLNDRFIDPIDEGFDVTVRIAQAPAAASLIVHALAPCPVVLCAAPSYLEQRSLPNLPGDLKHHDCLHYGHLTQDNAWTLIDADGQSSQIPIQGPLCCNNGEVLRQAALAGLGIVMLPGFIVAGDLQTGQLQPVLTAYQPLKIGIYALYPVNRHLSAKVKVLTEFLRQRLSSATLLKF